MGSKTRKRSRTSQESRRGNCYVTCEALYHLLGGKDGLAGCLIH